MKKSFVFSSEHLDQTIYIFDMGRDGTDFALGI